jgi:hypothetical protein
MPKPVYLLHWERNGELFFGSVLGRRTPPDEALALLRRRGVGSLVVEVPAALPPLAEGRVGHPTVDAWIAAGRAARRTGIAPRPVRPDRLLVLVDLLDPASPAGADPLEGRLEHPQALREQRGAEADPPDAQ